MAMLISHAARDGLVLVTSLLAMAHAAVGAPVQALFDPTRPYSATVAVPAGGTALPSLQLQAILHSKERCVAIINGRLVHAGDQLAGAAIASISPNTVHYVYRGRAYQLQLAPTLLPEAQLRLTRAPAAQDVSP